MRKLILTGLAVLLLAPAVYAQGHSCPRFDNEFDLGGLQCAGRRWRDLSVARNATIAGTLDLTGALTASGDITVNGAGLEDAVVRQVRQRHTIAAVNAGAEILAALPGQKYRMVSASLIAVGGAVTTVTTVDILATQAAGSVKLVAGAQASLTQSTEVKSGGSGGAILADGASYVANDVNTAITIGITGAAITVATNIDVLFAYVVEK